MSVYEEYLESVGKLLESEKLLKISLGNYKGLEDHLKNVYVKPVMIKRNLMLSFVYRYKTKDITKNYEIREAILELKHLGGYKGFRLINFHTVEENVIFQINKKGEWRVQKEKLQKKEELSYSHDKKKERRLNTTENYYLHELNLTDEEGNIYKNAQDKWKQINHYIEILSSALMELPEKEHLNVVDMGAGKGYLTFALYDYLQNSLNKKVNVVGVEFRKDLVDFCNQVASNSGFKKLSFEEGTIESYQSNNPIDILIALHACDTATDDAIYKGIQDQASLIVVAPCCHKQVRRELEKVKAKNELDFMTKYGIYMERHAEMLTDSIRALILEYYGYETKVMQFISDQHTAKNVMIVASKKKTDSQKQIEILAKLKNVKSYFGINFQHLELLCSLDK